MTEWNLKIKTSTRIIWKGCYKKSCRQHEKAGIEDVAVIVGENKEEIEGILKDEVTYLEQKGCLGTGQAIMQATSYLEGKTGKVVIANGNIPLITSETIRELVEKSEKENEAVTILTGIISEPTGYGRVIRENNRITEIIEEKELTEAEKKILEVNAGVYCYEISELTKIIGTLRKNSMGLYYLTDTVKMLVASGKMLEES